MVVTNLLFSEPGNYQMSDADQLPERRKQNDIRTTDLCTIMQNACGNHLTQVMLELHRGSNSKYTHFINLTWDANNIVKYPNYITEEFL